MKYNLREIMVKAWAIYRKRKVSFSEALHRAWVNAKAKPVNEALIKVAKAAAGITEEVNTWYGWKKAGFEVAHGSKALFQCDLVDASKGEGMVYKASFFSRSQVEACA